MALFSIFLASCTSVCLSGVPLILCIPDMPLLGLPGVLLSICLAEVLLLCLSTERVVHVCLPDELSLCLFSWRAAPLSVFTACAVLYLPDMLPFCLHGELPSIYPYVCLPGVPPLCLSFQPADSESVFLTCTATLSF